MRCFSWLVRIYLVYMTPMEQFIVNRTPIKTKRSAQLLFLLISAIFFVISLFLLYEKILAPQEPTPLYIQEQIKIRNQQ